MKDRAQMAEQAVVGIAAGLHDEIRWRARWKVEKFHASEVAQHRAGLLDLVEPYEVIEREGNLLVFGGASALWDLLKGAGNVSAFSNANAHLGVGDSSTAAAATQTDLQAASNKFREPMDATYPLHTDGTVDGSDDIVFKSTFESADANFAWNEWAVFNASSAGRMLNRKVESLGTKTSAGVWALTVTLSLS